MYLNCWFYIHDAERTISLQKNISMIKIEVEVEAELNLILSVISAPLTLPDNKPSQRMSG